MRYIAIPLVFLSLAGCANKAAPPISSSANPVSTSTAITPTFPITLHRTDDQTAIVVLRADGSLEGDKAVLSKLLSEMTGPVTPEAAIFWLIVHDLPTPCSMIPGATEIPESSSCYLPATATGSVGKP